MVIVLFLCLASFILYMMIGLYSFILSPDSSANRVFLLITLLYSLWSLSAFVRNLSDLPQLIQLWRYSSQLCWTFGSAAILHFCYILTRTGQEHPVPWKKYLPLYLYIPDFVIFLLFTVSEFSRVNQNLFVIPDFYLSLGSTVFYLFYLTGTLTLVYRWSVFSDSKRVKKQSRLIMYSLMISTFCILLYGFFLPMMINRLLPFLLPVFSLFWISGMGLAISRYRLLEFKPNIAMFEVMDSILEIIIFTDHNGNIVELNHQAEYKLGYKKEDLFRKKYDVLFFDKLEKDTKSAVDINLKRLDGGALAVRLQLNPVLDREGDVLGYVLSALDLTQEKKYKALSITDKLTQVYNRLKLDSTLDYELNQARRYKQSFSLFLMDLDYFKQVNDHYGHQTGDMVLVEVAAFVRSSLRESDTFGRWGGEEFLAILPNTDLYAAMVTAEKIRITLAEKILSAGLTVSASFGVTCFEGIDDLPSRMISRVDSALYKAKQNGRNRVESE